MKQIFIRAKEFLFISMFVKFIVKQTVMIPHRIMMAQSAYCRHQFHIKMEIQN